MKVLLINGSPNPDGCTYTALREVAGALEQNGVETEIFQIGRMPVRGCIDCGGCRNNRCAFDDIANQALAKFESCDALVIGSPVYYAAPNGSLISLLNRMFFAGSALMRLKPAACNVSARRAGTTAALEVLNKYPTIAQMPLVSSTYWNMVHGNEPAEVMKDDEGVKTMRVLGANMAYLLKCIEAGKVAGVTQPAPGPRVFTNFIR
jgi:multimeric flavodoxin WrbA